MKDETTQNCEAVLQSVVARPVQQSLRDVIKEGTRVVCVLFCGGFINRLSGIPFGFLLSKKS